MIHVQGVKRT